ncbi:uncharacterized protein LY79DRAFT_72529 [Colletotrichum navitas]|uniref:Uncharacterized protein n=1 Tax=Colletotrichum navitas TaxID=681940 RepID=A0AAD8UZ98_9PEZI|nr:uncharacterized protein LY79DRAFT_72529 [Colletotrichum navitas]KAK1569584.1 hypothetical protein LY79DRAFT_72529 [Colletotrichum navitas]
MPQPAGQHRIRATDSPTLDPTYPGSPSQKPKTWFDRAIPIEPSRDHGRLELVQEEDETLKPPPHRAIPSAHQSRRFASCPTCTMIHLGARLVGTSRRCCCVPQTTISWPRRWAQKPVNGSWSPSCRGSDDACLVHFPFRSNLTLSARLLPHAT